MPDRESPHPSTLPAWKRAMLRGMTRMHVALYRASGGRVFNRVPGADGQKIPVLLLTARGRRSGRRRTLPLLYLADDGYVVVASGGGPERDPPWVANLLAAGAAEVQIGTTTIPVVPERVIDADRARLWPILARMFPRWDAMQRETERPISVVRLRPASPGRDAPAGRPVAGTDPGEPQPRVTTRSALTAAIPAAAVAAATNAAAFLLFDALGALPAAVIVGSSGQPITLGPVVAISLAGAVAAAGVLAALARFADRPVRWFQRIAAVVWLLSVASPFTLSAAPARMIAALLAMHVVVWAVSATLLVRWAERDGAIRPLSRRHRAA